jgi:hypothetical protein
MLINEQRPCKEEHIWNSNSGCICTRYSFAKEILELITQVTKPCVTQRSLLENNLNIMSRVLKVLKVNLIIAVKVLKREVDRLKR